MGKHLRSILITTALCGMASAAHAQSGSPPVGTTLRLTMRGQPLQVHGTVRSTSPTTWTLARPNAADSAYALSDISAAETQVSHRRTLRGALIGGGIGLAGGLALVLAEDDDPCAGAVGPCLDFESEGNAAALIVLPLVGAGAGALIGSLFKSTRWVPTVVPRTATGASRIGMRLSFR